MRRQALPLLSMMLLASLSAAADRELLLSTDPAVLAASQVADSAPPRGEVIPEAKIIGPATANIGDLVILDASASTGIGYAWVLADSDKNFYVPPNGLQAIFATGVPGRYSFVLIAVGVNKESAPLVSTAKHILMVTGPSPVPPGPDPGPGPNPIPPEPAPDLTGVQRDVWTWASALVGVDKAKTSKQAAAAFGGVAAAIAAGTCKTHEQAIKLLQESMSANMQPFDYAIWKSGWNPKFNAMMAALDDAGKLATLADVRQVFVDIEIGLNAVRSRW